MRTIIYSSADGQSTALRHFRNAEQELNDKYSSAKKGYDIDVKGWNLMISDMDTKANIDLKSTCNWEVYDYEDDSFTIRFDENHVRKELVIGLDFMDNSLLRFYGLRDVI